jgi:preprotein translocase subunit YajC
MKGVNSPNGLNLMQFELNGLMLAQSDNPTGGGAPQVPGESAGGTLTSDPATGGAAKSTNPASSWIIFLPLLAVMVFMIWTSSSAQRKERKKREAMLSALKRHDRVQTVGGVIGSVVEIKDTEVVLKVDEANNIKMRFAKSAVQQVLTEGISEETSVK